MNALDLHVEQRTGIDEQPKSVADNPGEGDLVGALHPLEKLLQCRVGAVFRQPGDSGRIFQHLRAQQVAKQPRQPWIGLVQPAPEGDAVGHVDDAARRDCLEVDEQRLAQQLGVQRRHSIGAVRADKGEVPHPDAPPVVFIDKRDCGGRRLADRMHAVCRRQMTLVNFVNDLQMARQYALEQWNRPGFESFRQQGVIRVRASRDGDVPGLVPGNIVQIDEDAHQLGDGDARMGVVELNGGLVRQGVDRAVRAAVPLHEVLERGGDKKVFLAQAELAPGRCRVARVEDLGQRLGPRLLGPRADMVAEVEDIEAHRIGGAGGPQAQHVDIGAAPADDRRVVGDGPDRFRGVPDMAQTAGVRCDGFDPSAIGDIVGNLGPLEFPGVRERQPLLGEFLLPAVLDDLAEQPVIIADAVTVSRQAEASHALHEARGEPAEAAVSESGIGLDRAHLIVIDAEVAERTRHDLGEAQIADDVVEQPADQKLQREVIDALAALCEARPVGGQPAVNDAVAQRQRGCDEPVAPGCGKGILADGNRELGQHRRFELLDLLVGCRMIGDRG